MAYDRFCHALFAMLALAVACTTDSAQRDRAGNTTATQPAVAATAITASELLRHIEVLASDEFEGRAPGTRGEQATVDYLTAQFRDMGLAPGNPDGTYVQKVPLVGNQSTAEVSMQVGGKAMNFTFPADYVAISRRMGPETRVDDAEIVFVGYGVVAPEYEWDDYKDVDVTGKTILMLVNDPPVPDPANPSQLDASVFRGRAMTYYGRWTYKYEIATEKGAAAAIVIHETGPAGYPYSVVSGSWGRENFDIERADGNQGRVAVEGWMARAAAEKLFASAGQDFESLKRAARQRNFRPISLKGTASFRIRNELRKVASQNVIARLPGADPAVREQAIIYTAHWDHLGRDPSLEGDQIFNGALDNATGVAGVLALARAFAAHPQPPRRSLLFLLVTAEEKGLLGSKYYAANPLYPLEKTLANINMDGLNPWGRTRDLTIVGYGNSNLDDLLIAAAKQQGRSVRPEDEPEKGYFYRSDHFAFAKRGVPALYIDPGIDFIDKPADFAERKRIEYVGSDYHQVSDEIKPDWDLSGAAEDLELLWQVGYEVANGSQWPEWKPGTEFKAVRDSMLGSQTR